MKINELSKKAHENARRHGFWEDFDIAESNRIIANEEIREQMKNNAISSRLMLIVSEVSEALEALRKGDKKNFIEEIADIYIRLGDLSGGLVLDIEAAIEVKMETNEKRPYKHGKQF